MSLYDQVWCQVAHDIMDLDFDRDVAPYYAREEEEQPQEDENED